MIGSPTGQTMMNAISHGHMTIHVWTTNQSSSCLNTDASFRAPLIVPDQHDQHFEKDIQAYMGVIVQDLLATEQRLEEIRLQQQNDPLVKKWSDTVKKVG